jgi:uncharacterized protein YwgA
MKRLQKAAVLARLTDELRANQGWAGETQLQKAAYFLQQLCRVPLDYDFVLYKYGPFSFDLREELTSLRADRILTLEPQPFYGPRFAVSESGLRVEQTYPKTLQQFERELDFVAEELGPLDVAGLERVATALYVTAETPDASVDERARSLRAIKPHIAESSAEAAIEEVDRLRAIAPKAAA